MKKLNLKLQFDLWYIALILPITVIWFLPWRFQTNDDVIMMWLVSGAYTGEPEPYAVFIHPWLSYFLSRFYYPFPEINWYGLTWFAIILFSGILLIGKIKRLGASQDWKSVLNLFVLMISIHLCVFPQFTLVAGFAAFSGMSRFFERGNALITSRLLGLILIFLALMVRLESVALIGIGWAWSELIFPIQSRVKAVSLAVIISILAVSTFVGKRIYEQKNVEPSFLEFNRARAKVIDHPSFVSHYSTIVFEPNSDWFFFSRWIFEELPIDLDQLTKKKEELDQRLFTWKEVGSGLYRLILIQLTELFKGMLILALIIGFFSLRFELKKKLAYFLIWLIFFLIFNHFNMLLGRVIFLFFIVLLFPILNYPKLYSSFPYIKYIRIVFFVFIGIHLFNFLKYSEGRKLVNKEFNTLINYNHVDRPVFIEGIFEYVFMDHFSRINPVPILSNGWVSRSPFQLKAYKLRGFSKQSELFSFYLIAPRIPEPLVFPEYMNKISSDFKEKKIAETSNLELLYFYKK